MQINSVNNSQPTFGMAYNVSKCAAKMLQPSLEKGSSAKIVNMLALQNAFNNSPDILDIKSASEGAKGLKRLFTNKLIKLSYSREDLGRGLNYFANAKGFMKHPELYLRKVGGDLAGEIYKDSRKEVVKSLAGAALNVK